MNELITKILKNHLENRTDDTPQTIDKHLNDAIIEICEEQKKECANNTFYESDQFAILNSKNIAI